MNWLLEFYHLGGALSPELIHKLWQYWAEKNGRLLVSWGRRVTDSRVTDSSNNFHKDSNGLLGDGARFLGDGESRTRESRTRANVPLETMLAWTAEWGRSEIRLLEMLLDWLWEHWREVHPLKLNEEIRKMPTPAVWGILWEWTCLRKKEESRTQKSRTQVSEQQKAFWTLVIEGIKPVSDKMFFSEGKLLTYQKALPEIQKTLPFYKKWGFIGHDLPSISDWKNCSGPIPSKKERLTILNQWITKEPITLEKYLKALDYKISRQTAWRDFHDATFLTPRGQTKGRKYFPNAKINKK